jgi:hypothetical protein
MTEPIQGLSEIARERLCFRKQTRRGTQIPR